MPKAAKARAKTTSEQLKLGQRIRFLRGDDTQETASARIGISQRFLSELERGRKTPSWETLLDIAHRGFGITIAALLFGIDDEAGTEARRIDELLAGRSPQTQHALDSLQAGKGGKGRSLAQVRETIAAKLAGAESPKLSSEAE